MNAAAATARRRFVPGRSGGADGSQRGERHLHRDRARLYRRRASIDGEDLPLETEMRDLDAITQRGRTAGGRLDVRVSGQPLHAFESGLHLLSTALEVGARLLALAEALPFFVHGAANVGDQSPRLVPGARGRLASGRVGTFDLGLRAAQETGALGLAALDQRRPLGLPPVSIVEPGQELLELALLGRAIAVSSFDQSR